jgi:hypothetical protein
LQHPIIRRQASSNATVFGGATKGDAMFKAEHFRTKQAEIADSMKDTDTPSETRKHEQSMKSFGVLAENEDWLADNFHKMVHARDLPSKDEPAAKSADSEAAAKIEEHILRCLGASVMMHWSAIPTKLQRELFDTAGSMGDVLQTGALRGQVARFLHKNHDEEVRADSVSKPESTNEIPTKRLPK